MDGRAEKVRSQGPKQAATYTRKARQQKLARASMHLLSSMQNNLVS
jgi:hypothetical protein